MGTLWLASTAWTVVAYSCAQRRLDELDAQVAALQATQSEDERKIADLVDLVDSCCDCFGRGSDDERAALQAQLDAAKRKSDEVRSVRVLATLPKCRCTGTGDPLCSEIPGQTCAP